MTTLRELETASIRDFLEKVAKTYLQGDVLDYGCGKQPYRDIVISAGGNYAPFDRAGFAANVSGVDVGENDLLRRSWDTVLMTQVLQYIPDPRVFIGNLKHHVMRKESYLVMTYPTTWPEVEPHDLHRFTKAGMERLLDDSDFDIHVHMQRAIIYPSFPPGQTMKNDILPLGYGVVGQVRP